MALYEVSHSFLLPILAGHLVNFLAQEAHEDIITPRHIASHLGLISDRIGNGITDFVRSVFRGAGLEQ